MSATDARQRQCQPIFSFVNYLYSSNGPVGEGLPGKADGSGPLGEVAGVVDLAASTMGQQNSPVDFFFGKDFNQASRSVSVLRSRIRTGLPLSGYLSSEDQASEQEKLADAFLIDLHENFLYPELKEFKGGELEFTYMGAQGVAQVWIEELLAQDGSLAFGSFLFVFCFIWFHTGSAFVAGFGMLHILLSLPIAIVIVTKIFGVNYFDFLNMFMRK